MDMGKRIICSAMILFSTFSFLSFNTDNSAKIIGFWWSPEKKSKIKIFKSTDGKYYGNVVWLKDAVNEDGTPKKDKNNPKLEKRKNTIVNLQILKSFVFDGDKHWEDGTVYDPENGKTYSCTMTLQDENTLNLRGYIGVSLLGRTAVFTRAD